MSSVCFDADYLLAASKSASAAVTIGASSQADLEVPVVNMERHTVADAHAMTPCAHVMVVALRRAAKPASGASTHSVIKIGDLVLLNL